MGMRSKQEIADALKAISVAWEKVEEKDYDDDYGDGSIEGYSHSVFLDGAGRALQWVLEGLPHFDWYDLMPEWQLQQRQQLEG